MNVALTALIAMLVWLVLKPLAKFRPLGQKKQMAAPPTRAGPRRSARLAQTRPPPELLQLQRLVEVFHRRQDFNAALDVGTMYQRGVYPHLVPNDVLASEIFRAVAARSGDPNVSAQAVRMYFEVFATPVPLEDREGAPMPEGPGRELVRLIEGVRPQAADAMDPWAAGDDYDFQVALALQLEEQMQDRPFQQVPMLLQQPNDPVRRALPVDRFSQSSHDHGVVRAVESTLEALPEADDIDTKAIRASIMGQDELTPLEKENALKVLRVSLGVDRDREALGKVWSKIQEEPDRTVRNNRIETLAKQLADGVENGNVVCSTGRVSRMVSALMGQDRPDDEIVRIRSTEVVGQEINQMAAYVRDQVLADASHTDRLDYASGNGDTSFLSREMEKRLRERVRETYVEDLKMSAQILEPLVETAASSF